MKLIELLEEIKEDYLYHGSKANKLKILLPKKNHLMKKDVVFAASDERFALAMIYGTDDDFDIGYVTSNNKRTMYLKEKRKNAFSLYKKPGVLYYVSKKLFKKFKDIEYISFKPIQVEKYINISNVFSKLKSYRNIKFIEYKGE